MTALSYSYQVTSYDQAAQIATTVYTPNIDTLPAITLQVPITPEMNTTEMQIAISQRAPFETWWELDPSTKPVPVSVPWQVFPQTTA